MSWRKKYEARGFDFDLGNIILTLKGLLRLELSQNKSNFFKKIGSIWKFSSQIYALFCRIMSQQTFSHFLNIFFNTFASTNFSGRSFPCHAYTQMPDGGSKSAPPPEYNGFNVWFLADIVHPNSESPPCTCILLLQYYWYNTVSTSILLLLLPF